jgi:hypothetical protein
LDVCAIRDAFSFRKEHLVGLTSMAWAIILWRQARFAGSSFGIAWVTPIAYRVMATAATVAD